MIDVVMSTPDPSPAAEPTAKSPEIAVASVIDPSDTDAPSYAMFEIERVSVAGAFLVGAVFFERGEEFLVEIGGEPTKSFRVRARVLDHTRTPRAGMTVEFIDVADAERSALTAMSRARD